MTEHTLPPACQNIATAMCEPCRPQRGRDGFAGDSRRRRAGFEAETDAAATPVHGEATWEREGGRRRLIPRGAGGSKTQRQHREESTYLGSHGGESVTDEGMRDRLGGSRWLVRRMMLAKKDAGERSWERRERVSAEKRGWVFVYFDCG